MLQVDSIETFPRIGQNLWWCYKDVKNIETLINSLAENGIRESELKKNLTKALPDIQKNLTNFKLQELKG